MLLDHLTDRLLYGDHVVVIAVPAQSLLHQGREKRGLIGLLHGKRRPQKTVGQLAVAFLLLAGVIKGAVEIGHAVVVGREEEALVRLLDHPFPSFVDEHAGVRIVAEAVPALCDGTEGAQKEGVDIVRPVLQIVPVRGPGGNVVHAVDQKDQVLARRFVGLHYLFKEFGDQVLVFQFALLEPVEEFLAAPLLFLLQRELQVEEVPSQLSGKGLFEDITVFFRVFLLHGQEGLLHFHEDLAVIVHINAPEPVDGAVLGGQELSDLGNRFLIHMIPFCRPQKAALQFYHLAEFLTRKIFLLLSGRMVS